MLMFLIGGTGYTLLEVLYRGYTHITMFFAGGTCFLLINKICNHLLSGCKNLSKCIAGSAIITSVELITGLIFNKDLKVWDYTQNRPNYKGQICLKFSLIWALLTLPVMLLAKAAEKKFQKI